MWKELIAMDVEFRIGAGAQFVQIHPLQLAFTLHALPIDTIQQPVQSIGQRQDKAQQRRHSHQLRQPLPVRSPWRARIG